MRKKIFTAAAAVILMVAAAAASQADTGEASAKKIDYFNTKVTPSSGVKSGATLTTKSTGAQASTAYYCVVTAYTSKAGEGESAPDSSTLKVVKSSSTGAITCKVQYKKFKAKDSNGTMRHCPTTKADKADGYKCGVALADQATIGAVSASVGPFTPAK